MQLTFPVSFSAPDEHNISFARYIDAGSAAFIGSAVSVAPSTMYLVAANASATFLVDVNVNATTPFTWTTNDKIYVNFFYRKA